MKEARVNAMEFVWIYDKSLAGLCLRSLGLYMRSWEFFRRIDMRLMKRSLNLVVVLQIRALSPSPAYLLNPKWRAYINRGQTES